MKFSPETTNRIAQWKENLTAMPTDQFLNYARMFLGEIETPFNKQNLVTQISTFFCQTENKKNAVALMGKNDLKILSLVKLVPESTKESIVKFFSDEDISFAIRAHLQNLEERMVLYTVKSNSGKTVYCINPILEDELGSKIGMETLIEKSNAEKNADTHSITLSPNFLAAFISFALYHSDICKGDGSIKKKALKDFAAICGVDDSNTNDDSDFSVAVGLLISSFRNLLLFADKNGSFVPDWQRLTNFSKLSEIQQYIYLCSGAFWKGHSRRSLYTVSQLLLDTLVSMKNFSYTRKMILRMGALIYSLTQDSEKSTSRFEMLMSKTANEEIDFSPISKLDQLIDSCLAFGLMNKVGEDEDGQEILQASPIFYQEKNLDAGEQKCVSVEAGFSVTVMPGLGLDQILPLMKFMDIKHLDVVAVFEINRKSALRAFDLGMDLASIENLLEKNSGYEIPQNLTVSLEDWFNTYSSATLFNGYVLKLNESNVVLAEKNKVLAPHILAKLASNVFLLDFKDDFEASAVIAQSGLNFIGKVKKCSKENDVPALPFLRENSFSFVDGLGEKNPETDSDETETEKIIQSMKDRLEKMNITTEQKEGLLSRINRRIIVNEKQLCGQSVHFDRKEASAMDNSGKVYIIDRAMQDENLVEITMDINALPQLGLPIALDKKNGTVTIRKKNGNEITLPISAAVKVKKVPIEFDF